MRADRPNRPTFRRVRRDVHGGWWAEAGFEGFSPYWSSAMTKTGARLAAYRMESRLRRGAS